MNKREQILDIVKKHGVIRAADLEKVGISRNYLYSLCKEGLLNRLGRGLYISTDTPITEHINLIEVSKRVPSAVICLVSALSFHHMTTQIPHEIWIALPKGAWKPKLDYPPLNTTFVSRNTYFFGMEEHLINGVSVKIYSPAKTVADCFKFRNKIGLDIAIEALREVCRDKKATVNELMKAADVCRVLKIMQPYMEAII